MYYFSEEAFSKMYSSNGQNGPQRVQVSDESRLAPNYRHSAINMPSLQAQSNQMKDLKARIAERQRRLGKMSQKEIAEKAKETEKTRDPIKMKTIGRLEPVDLTRTRPAFGSADKQEVKIETGTLSDFQQQKQDLLKRKAALTAKIENQMNKKRIKKEGGTRFSEPGIKQMTKAELINSFESSMQRSQIDLTDESTSNLTTSEQQLKAFRRARQSQMEADHREGRETRELLTHPEARLEAKAPKPMGVDPGNFDSMGNALDAKGKKMDLKMPEKTFKINQRVAKRDEFRSKYARLIGEKPETQQEALEKVAQIKNEGIIKNRDITEENPESMKATVLRTGDEISEKSIFFDPRFKEKKNPFSRERRSFFNFHDQGTYVKQGNIIRKKAQLNNLQGQIEKMARRTGIQQSSKLATVAHASIKDNMALPLDELNWWDQAILPKEQHDIEKDFRVPEEIKKEEEGEDQENAEEQENNEMENETIDNQPTKPKIKIEPKEENETLSPDTPYYKFIDISALIEHPVELVPPMKSTHSVQIPVYYTKSERKKRRRLRRRDELKEQQEKIRLGLVPPPEPKVKLANMMQVLSNEAVIDPTKVEIKVREQMAERQKKHFTENFARQLTKDERRVKVEKKLKEDLTHGVQVAIYLIKDLRHAATRWKLKENCKQLYMTGICITTPEHSIIIVEGGPKSQRKFFGL